MFPSYFRSFIALLSLLFSFEAHAFQYCNGTETHTQSAGGWSTFPTDYDKYNSNYCSDTCRLAYGPEFISYSKFSSTHTFKIFCYHTWHGSNVHDKDNNGIDDHEESPLPFWEVQETVCPTDDQVVYQATLSEGQNVTLDELNIDGCQYFGELSSPVYDSLCERYDVNITFTSTGQISTSPNTVFQPPQAPCNSQEPTITIPDSVCAGTTFNISATWSTDPGEYCFDPVVQGACYHWAIREQNIITGVNWLEPSTGGDTKTFSAQSNTCYYVTRRTQSSGPIPFLYEDYLLSCPTVIPADECVPEAPQQSESGDWQTFEQGQILNQTTEAVHQELILTTDLLDDQLSESEKTNDKLDIIITSLEVQSSGFSHTTNQAQNFSEVFQNFYQDVSQTPIVSAFNGFANVIPTGTGQCPVFSIDLTATPVAQVISTNIHCTLAESIRSLIQPLMLLFFAIVSFRALVSA